MLEQLPIVRSTRIRPGTFELEIAPCLLATAERLLCLPHGGRVLIETPTEEAQFQAERGDDEWRYSFSVAMPKILEVEVYDASSTPADQTNGQ